MIKVLTYGTFDYFHYGHYNLLRRAKALGDYLIVGVSTDDLCKEKGKCTILSLQERIDIVKNLKFVDQVIEEKSLSQKIEDAKKYDVDIFVLGSDYKDVFPKMKEYDKLLELGVKVIFLERTPNISTSELKNKLKKQTELDGKQ